MIKSKLVLALALSVGLVGSAAAALTDMTSMVKKFRHHA